MVDKSNDLVVLPTIANVIHWMLNQPTYEYVLCAIPINLGYDIVTNDGISHAYMRDKKLPDKIVETMCNPTFIGGYGDLKFDIDPLPKSITTTRSVLTVLSMLEYHTPVCFYVNLASDYFIKDGNVDVDILKSVFGGLNGMYHTRYSTSGSLKYKLVVIIDSSALRHLKKENGQAYMTSTIIETNDSGDITFPVLID